MKTAANNVADQTLSNDDFPLGRSNSWHPGRLLLKQLIVQRVEEYEPADQKSFREYKGRKLRSRQDIITEVVEIMKKRPGMVKEKTRGGTWVNVPDFEDRLRKRVSNDFLSHIKKLSRNRAVGEDPVIDDSQIRSSILNKQHYFSLATEGLPTYRSVLGDDFKGFHLSTEKNRCSRMFSSRDKSSIRLWSEIPKADSQHMIQDRFEKEKKRAPPSALGIECSVGKRQKVGVGLCTSRINSEREEQEKGLKSFPGFIEISRRQSKPRETLSIRNNEKFIRFSDLNISTKPDNVLHFNQSNSIGRNERVNKDVYVIRFVAHMRSNQNNAQVQSEALKIILQEIRTNEGGNKLVEICDAGGIQTVVEAIMKHCNDVDVIKKGYQVLGLLVSPINDPFQPNKCYERDKSTIQGINIIIRAMKDNKEDAKMQSIGIEALTCMKINDLTREMVYEIVSAMKLYAYDPLIQQKGCVAIASFVRSNMELGKKLAGAGRIILNAMQNHTLNTSVQRDALKAISALIFENFENQNNIFEADGIVIILTTMRCLPDEKQAKEDCCEILKTFACLSSPRRDAVVSAVLEDLRYHPDPPMKDQIKVLAAVACNDWNSLQGVVNAALEYMVDDFEDVVVQRTGCQVLAGLAVELSENKSAIVKANAIPVLKEALKRHPTDASIQRDGNTAINRLE